MAPEQARGEELDARADLFSLGSVLYAMCTGHPPFRAGSPLAVLRRVCDETPRPVRDVNPDVPDWLAEVVAQLHEKDPARRFQSAAEVAGVLGGHLAHLQHPATVPAPARLQPARPGRRDMALALVGLCLAFAVVVLVVAMASATQFGLSRIAVGGGLLLAASMLGVVLIAGLLFATRGARSKRTGGAAAAPAPARLQPSGLSGPKVALGLVGSFVVLAVAGGAWALVAASLVRSGIAPGGIFVLGISTVAVALLVGLLLIGVWTALLKGGRGAAAAARPAAAPAEVARPPRPAGCVWVAAAALAVLVACGLFGFVSLVLYFSRSTPSTTLVRSVAPATAPALGPRNPGLREPLGHFSLKADAPEDVRAVAFSPDGNTLVAVSGTAKTPGGVEFWDASPLARPGWKATEVRASRSLKLAHGVRCAAFSPDGRQLATGEYDNSVRLRDPATGAERASLKGHDKPVTAVVFTPDGKGLVSASLDGTAKLWDVETRGVRRTFRGHESGVLCAALSRDGRLPATGGMDKAVRRWDVDTGQELPYVPPADWPVKNSEHRGPVECVAFDSDGRKLATGGADGAVMRWDARTGRGLATLGGHGGRVSSVAFSPDGQTLASVGFGGEVRLWDAQTGRVQGGFRPAEMGDAHSVTFRRDGRTLAAGGWGNRVLLWDLGPAH
jgi:WD40 repeat protein